MTDLLSFLQTLHRPKLLVRAARLGLMEYNRTRVLKRIAPGAVEASSGSVLRTLIPVEEALEEARRAGDASYVPSRHVEVLIALLGEFRRATQPA